MTCKDTVIAFWLLEEPQNQKSTAAVVTLQLEIRRSLKKIDRFKRAEVIITSYKGMNENREVSSSKDIKIRLMNAILTTRTCHQIGIQ